MDGKSKVLILSAMVVTVFLITAGCLGEDEEQHDVNLEHRSHEVIDVDFDGKEPKEGYVFHEIKVVMENKEDDVTLEIETDNFGVVNDTKEETYTPHQEKNVPDTLDPDESATFTLLFEVPEDIWPDRIVYEQ